MRMSWLVCVLLGALPWGQAQEAPQNGPPPGGMSMRQQGPPPPSTAEVPENAAVITIVGVCSPALKAASKAPAGKTAAKKPADCKTVITRAEFERIAKALQQGPVPLTPQRRQQLATMLPRFMAMSDAAKERGLDKTAHFTEMMKLVRMQILTQELQRSLQEEADKISDADMERQYKDHPQDYEQFSLDRIFIPRYKQQPPETRDEEQGDEKLSEEQRKAKETADRVQQEQGEQQLDKLAESLETRAAAGEDFAKLQKEAFDAAGMKMESPTINLPKVRRSGLPPSQTSVFDVKVGQISQVISDNSGHYIYKVVSEETLPFDQVKEEIHNTLRSERFRALMEKYQNSYHVQNNETYFQPMPTPGPHPGMPMHSMPQGQARPPATKPN